MFYNKSQIRSMFLLLFFLFFSVILVYSFAGGDGSLGSPYQITNCSELQNMSFDLSANYTLNNDINCGVAPFNAGLGFRPVGNCTGNCFVGDDEFPFTGSLNGSGYEIQNLYINRGLNDTIGLFGTANNSVISFVRLTNVNINGSSQVGGIVGWNNGLIINSSVTGTIRGVGLIGGIVGNNYRNGHINHSFSSVTMIASGNSVGGLAGASSYAKIDNSYAIGSTQGLGSVGGFVGFFYYGEIDNSYSSGNVNGSSNIGGLVGYNKGVGAFIDNSYATGAVNGSSNVGGLVGLNFGFIDESFSIGFVKGSSNVGGLVGSGGAGVTSSFWDNETSNRTTSAAGTQKSTAEMFLQSTYSGWSTSIWDFTNLTYPHLYWEGYVYPSSPPTLASIFPVQGLISVLLVFLGVVGFMLFS